MKKSIYLILLSALCLTAFGGTAAAAPKGQANSGLPGLIEENQSSVQGCTKWNLCYFSGNDKDLPISNAGAIKFESSGTSNGITVDFNSLKWTSNFNFTGYIFVKAGNGGYLYWACGCGDLFTPDNKDISHVTFFPSGS
ncbi:MULTISPECIES: hypothetical protein [Paenibacillus]|uniref:Uncharacterized protein n=1 Tax=Paenibacillus lignilyticus TaxID=1172615 RepID=A0ABS5C7S0_9BACL|nr:MULTISPECIES: hypothetical protein [Paenibacillus]MBP3961890.1 hypothetical protein [Paenibacillus lignilyticus]SFS53305.1 hypothetical protein SAMN05428962_0633 [Paenibacillus sp. BC26]